MTSVTLLIPLGTRQAYRVLKDKYLFLKKSDWLVDFYFQYYSANSSSGMEFFYAFSQINYTKFLQSLFDIFLSFDLLEVTLVLKKKILLKLQF